MFDIPSVRPEGGRTRTLRKEKVLPFIAAILYWNRFKLKSNFQYVATSHKGYTCCTVLTVKCSVMWTKALFSVCKNKIYSVGYKFKDWTAFSVIVYLP